LAVAKRNLQLGGSRILEAPISPTGGRTACTALFFSTHPRNPHYRTDRHPGVAVPIEVQARVPQDLSVAGIDNPEIAEHTLRR
jgi:hypothetical protein